MQGMQKEFLDGAERPLRMGIHELESGLICFDAYTRVSSFSKILLLLE